MTGMTISLAARIDLRRWLMTDREAKLIKFAEVVLREMEVTADWDADMLDVMGHAAIELGLSTTNEFMEFVRT
jgi:hypothetical protein